MTSIIQKTFFNQVKPYDKPRHNLIIDNLQLFHYKSRLLVCYRASKINKKKRSKDKYFFNMYVTLHPYQTFKTFSLLQKHFPIYNLKNMKNVCALLIRTISFRSCSQILQRFLTNIQMTSILSFLYSSNPVAPIPLQTFFLF